MLSQPTPAVVKARDCLDGSCERCQEVTSRDKIGTDTVSCRDEEIYKSEFDLSVTVSLLLPQLILQSSINLPYTFPVTHCSCVSTLETFYSIIMRASILLAAIMATLAMAAPPALEKKVSPAWISTNRRK